MSTIKIKRSAVQGKVPLTTDLELGELAINTYDGKLYLKKNVGGTESVVDVSQGGSATDILNLIKTVDGPGSGLDADLLDGQEGSYYLDWTNTTNKPDPNITVTLSGDVTGTANTTLTDLTSGTISITTTIASNSVALGADTTGNYVASIANGSYITGGDGGSEGAALTLAVDATSDATASKVVARDASGNFSANTITASISGNATTATTLATTRTIWGQNFNGSANVTGNLTNVGNITGSGAVTIATSSNGNLTLTPNGTGLVTISNSTSLGGNLNNNVRVRRIQGSAAIYNIYSDLYLLRDATGTDWTTARWHDAVGVDSSFLTPRTDTRVWYERDPNNRIHEWGTDAVSAMTLNASTTSGASSLVVSGNVGIGTTEPGSKLDVNGSTIVRGDAFVTGSVYINGVVNEDRAIEVGRGRTGSGNSYIDFIGDTTYTDYGLRVIRGPGANAVSQITHRGTGVLALEALDAGSVSVRTTGVDRMVIDSAGRVGIGTPEPQFKLVVLGGSAAGQNSTVAIKTDNTDGASVLLLGDSAEDTVGELRYDHSSNTMTLRTNNANRVWVNSGGEVRVGSNTDQGTYNIQCNGTGVWGAGAYVNGSDARLKDDVAPIGSCLNVVRALNPVVFRYKPDFSSDQSLQPGFIAQELQEVFADKAYAEGIVQAGPEYLNVSYQTLIPVLTAALQEADRTIQSLNERVAALEDLIQTLVK